MRKLQPRFSRLGQPGRAEFCKYLENHGPAVRLKLLGLSADGEIGGIVNRQELDVLNSEELLDRVGGDIDLLQELAGVFREDCPKLLAEIRWAVAAENAPALMRAAHTLKGAVANFGADAAREAASRLETMARAGDLKPAHEAVGELESEIQRFERALSALAQRLSTA